MLASDFQRKLRKLNPELHIFCGDNDSRLAGIFHVVGGEYKDLIGIDKNYIPEWPQVDEMGRIVKSGWRRVMRHLIEAGFVDRRRAERVFSTQIIGTRKPDLSRQWEDPINKEINKAYERGFLKTGKPAMAKDDLMDLANVISKQKEDKSC